MDLPRRLFLLVISLLTMLIGLRMLSGEQSDYPDVVYRTAFQSLTFTQWGWAFTVVGASMLVAHRKAKWAVAPFVLGAALWTWWAFCIVVEIPKRAGVLNPCSNAIMCIIGAYAIYLAAVKEDEERTERKT